MIASTGCGSPSNVTGNPPPKSLTSVSLTPSSVSIGMGATQQFSATAKYSDNTTADVSPTANWNVATQTVATINSRGLATGVAPGSSAITASFSGISGTATLTVQNPTKTLTSVSVSPASANVEKGATQQFGATAIYSDGSVADVSATAIWNVATQAVATINSSGLATGVASGSSVITASFSGISGTATFTVQNPTLTSVSVSPVSASIWVSASQQFAATGKYSDGSTADVSGTASWTIATQAVASVTSNGLATAAASGSTAVTASLSGVSGTSTLSVGANVPMWHFDAQRSGLNAGEGSLTPVNVTAQTFGKMFSYLLDGYAYGQPLLVSNVTISGNTHNAVFVATEKDSVYAFDADTYGSGLPLWQVSLLQSGETPITKGSIQPYLGITSTPAIDLTSNTMYVVATQTSTSGSTFRLHGLDITSGVEKFGGPVTIQASVPGTNSDSVNGVVSLTTSCLQRSALLVANGSVFIGFGACHSGWLLSYNASTLAQTGVFNSSPNLNGEGMYGGAGGIWMGGGGPAADSSGNVYISTGNGPYDGTTAFGDSVLKFDSQLHLLDHFTPHDWEYMDCRDKDLGAGGLLLIPGSMEAVAGGKNGKLYLVNTAGLGGMQANDAGATQTLWFGSDLLPPYASSCTDTNGNTWTTDINSYEIFGTAAYFNGAVYLGVTPTASYAPGGLRQFAYTGQLTPGVEASSSILASSYGTTPFISADGTAGGIVWMIDHGQPLQSAGTQTAAILRAYDAGNLATELYDSEENSADAPGYGIKFTSPIVANGKVYITTGHDPVSAVNPEGELDVYGLKEQ